MNEKTRETPDGLTVITEETRISFMRDLEVRFIGKHDESYIPEVMKRIKKENPQLIYFFNPFLTEDRLNECAGAGHMTALAAFVLTYELFRRQAEANKAGI